jgi:signal transduction histidine kinase
MQAQPIPPQDISWLETETWLEYAPAALLKLEQTQDQPTLSPLNTSARRLLAPGGVSDATELALQLARQTDGSREVLSYESERGQERVLAAVSSINLCGQPAKIVALMPVESQLEAEALRAWQELVHALTHEIMNSLTPISSLSQTATTLLQDQPPSLSDLGMAVETIHKRAVSLSAFVEGFRSLARVAPAEPARIHLQGWFSQLHALSAPQWRATGGIVEFSVEPSSLELLADPGQLEQALLNLFANAAEACASIAAPQLQVQARLGRGGRLRIEVTDNGPGVPEALIPHIFTPFFSTKNRGSGIGLAMVRQLVHANGGTVRYAKPLQGGARFIIAF